MAKKPFDEAVDNALRRVLSAEDPDYGYTPKGKAKATLEVVANVISSKDAGKVWTVKRDTETNAYSCSCPSWVFRPQMVVYNEQEQRTCKHVRAVFENPAAFVEDGRTVTVREALLAAADTTNLRALLYERQWAELSVALAKRLEAAMRPAPTVQPTTGRAVRVIRLED